MVEYLYAGIVTRPAVQLGGCQGLGPGEATGPE
jgi:hypothetical protein